MDLLAVVIYCILCIVYLALSILIYRRPDEKVELSSEIGSSHPFVGLAFKLEVCESTFELHITVRVFSLNALTQFFCGRQAWLKDV